MEVINCFLVFIKLNLISLAFNLMMVIKVFINYFIIKVLDLMNLKAFIILVSIIILKYHFNLVQNIIPYFL